MPRTHFCILCAALAGLIALLILLSPSPAVAQAGETAPPAEAPKAGSVIEFGAGDKAIGQIDCSLLLLGTDKPQPGFKLLAMAKMADRSNPTRELVTDAKGAFTIQLKEKPTELRIFAFGDYVIPDGWSNVPLSRFKFEKAESWEVRVRPLRNVTLKGNVRIGGSGAPAVRANVMLAPLDVAQDGTSQIFDQPLGTMTDEDGNYEFHVPTGYYMLWAYWADRTKDQWVGHSRVIKQVEIFADKELPLTVEKGPTITGKIIDARTGQGIAANVNLYTNQYLRQLRNPSADGEFADEYTPDGKEIFWPVGTFKVQVWLVDPEDFTAVIRPAGSDAVMKILPNLKASELQGREIIWRLYDKGTNELEVKVTTHKQDLPINELDVQLLPKDIDVPEALKASLTASGVTDNNGKVKFMGLPKGLYEAYGGRGTMLLGTVKVTGELSESAHLKFEIPFVFGTVKLPDGALCKNVMAFVTMKAEGRTMSPYATDAFRKNPVLQEKGTVLVPLTRRGVTFLVQFAAFPDGRAWRDEDWASMEDFALITDQTEYKVDSEEAWEVNLTLKPNPNYKPKGEKKE